MAGVSPIIQSVPLVLTVVDEKGAEVSLTFRLHFDFNALTLVEEETGMSLLTGAIFSKPTAKTISTLFWAAIQESHPDYAGPEGLKRVRAMMTLRNSTEIADAVQEAYIVSLPDDQQKNIRELTRKLIEKGGKLGPLVAAAAKNAAQV